VVGGVGTLEEVFEIMTLRYLHQTDKPLVMLNFEQFYDPLIHLLEHMQAANFMRVGYTQLAHFAASIEDALHFIDTYPLIDTNLPKRDE